MPDVATRFRTCRFDQMAVQVKDKVHPDDADVDRYVGLEHIDAESLKIRRWGQPSDVESTKILFRSGDIIFGKRRAYQRKLAVADFDGICSAHAMVLRPKTDVVLKEFLPFFMQTDTFMERAVKISVGGLSPTINWKDLAKEEFALPPIDEQRRMVEVLMAATSVADRLDDCLVRGLDALLSLYQSAFGPLKSLSSVRVGIKLSDLSDIRRGASPRPIHDRRWFSDKGPGWIRIRDLPKDSRFIRVAPGEIILSIAATIGKPCVIDMDACIHDGFVVFKNLDSSLRPDFLYHYLRWVEPLLERKGLLGTQKNINTQIVGDLAISLPHNTVQQKWCKRFESMLDQYKSIANRKAQVQGLKRLVMSSGEEE
jgi:type I restriction enzyme, S subunit